MFKKIKAWYALHKAIKSHRPMKEILKLIDKVNDFYKKKK